MVPIISWSAVRSVFFNIGGKGKITADGQEYEMGYKDCLYITKGTKEVYFESEDASKFKQNFIW